MNKNIKKISNWEDRVKLFRILDDLGYTPWLGNGNVHWRTVGENLGTTDNGARNQYRRAMLQMGQLGVTVDDMLGVEPTFVPESPTSPYSVNEVVSYHDSPVADFTVEDFAKAMGIDPKYYEIGQGKFWGSLNNPQLSGSFVRKPILDENRLVKVLDFVQKKSPVKKVAKKKVVGEKLAIFNLYDVHLQKLSIDGMGLEETKEHYKTVLLDLVEQVLALPNAPTQALIVVGNDLSNSDNVFGTTSAGTPQQNSTSWQYGVDEQLELILWAVDLLRENFDVVYVKFVEGNHDRFSTYYNGKVVEAYYRNDPNVVIDNDHEGVKFHQHGKIGFMFYHGSEKPNKDYQGIFAYKGRKIWGDSVYHEVHTGHFHKTGKIYYMVDENFGLIIRYMPSLSVTDDWHRRKVYEGNNVGGTAIVYDETRPLVEFTSYLR